jgi:hypothetical protein
VLRDLPGYSRYLWTVLLSLLTTGAVVILDASRASASGIFNPALKAMECIVSSATTGGGVTNALLPKLPTLIFGAITLFIFAYILICLNQIFQAIRQGEEFTNLVIPFMSSFVGLLVIMIFQNLLFGSGGC